MRFQTDNHDTRFAELLNWSVNSPAKVLILCFVFIVLSTLGAKNLTFKGEYNVFFDDGNVQLTTFEEMQARFSKTDSLLVIVSPENGDIFTAEILSLIRSFTNAAWQTPYSSRVDSIANYQHTEAFEDDLLVGDLIPEELALNSDAILKIKEVALAEPVVRDALVSEKGDVAVINITVQLPEANKTAEVAEVYESVTRLVEQFQLEYPSVQFYKTGIVAMNYAFMTSAQDDVMTLVPLMLLIVMVFLTLMLRSTVCVIATLLVIICSVISTIGLSGWVGMYMTIATVNIPTLVLTLAVADCVHIIATMRHEILKGVPRRQAVKNSLMVNTTPVIITSVTTAVGFSMMNMSDSPVLRDFGTLAACGVMIACLFSLALLPALLCVLPVKFSANSGGGESQSMDRLGDFVVANRRVLFPLSIFLITAATILVPINKVNEDSVKYFDQKGDFRQGIDFMQKRISGMGSISVSIDTKEDQGIVSTEFLKKMEAFTTWLREQPEVDHVGSLTDVYKRLNKNMHGDDEGHYLLPENRELAAQYLLMYEMSLPYGLDLNNQVSIDKSALRIHVTTKNMGSIDQLSFESRIYNWFKENSSGEYIVKASSPFLMFAHIGETNMKSMLISLPISILLISCLLLFALRSFRLGVISLFPTMAPALVGFGIWALISGEINLGLSVVASLTLGIVVDDAVHFLAKYQLAKKSGKSAEDSVRYAFRTVGRALWITTVVLVAGFCILAMSTFRLNADMGKLSSIVIFLALAIDFFFLPCLLMKFDAKRSQ